MSRNISDVIAFIQYIIRKERGVFLPSEKATANLDAAQLDCLEEWFLPYGATQEIHDALRPFRTYYQFASDASGFVTFPSDYLHIVGSPFTINGSTVNEITFTNEDKFVKALNSQLRPISISRPMARDTSAGFSIYPQTSQAGFFTYLRRPNIPVYAYIVGGSSGRQILYDAANSVQLEWADVYINKIIAKSLKYVGINMDEDKILAFAEQQQKES